MNCTACTYCNDYNQTSCIICNTALIGEADERKTESSFKKWLTDRGLASISSKVDESIVEESTELPNILDTSSKTTRKQAIKLAYEIGLYKGEKKGIVPEPNSKKEKILEDRMIRQEQDLKSEILILQEKLNEYENKVKEFEFKENLLKMSEKLKESHIQKEEVPKELSLEERRKIVSESWAKK